MVEPLPPSFLPRCGAHSNQTPKQLVAGTGRESRYCITQGNSLGLPGDLGSVKKSCETQEGALNWTELTFISVPYFTWADRRETKREKTKSVEVTRIHFGSLRKAFGENNIQTAKHYGNLGRLYQSMRRYEVREVCRTLLSVSYGRLLCSCGLYIARILVPMPFRLQGSRDKRAWEQFCARRAVVERGDSPQQDSIPLLISTVLLFIVGGWEDAPKSDRN